MSDHVTDRAGFLAALSDRDPERKAAEAHAAGCAPCREALREGAEMVALLRQALPATSPVRWSGPRPVTGEHPAAPEPPTLLGATIGAVALAWLFQISVGGGFRFHLACVAESLAILAVALGCVTVLRRNERLAVATVIVTSGLFAYFAGRATGFAPGVGIRCTFRELWAAALTWILLWAFARRAGVMLDRTRTTAVVAAGALAAHAGQHLACSVPHSDAHLLVFHFGGVVLATLIAAVGGRGTNAVLGRLAA